MRRAAVVLGLACVALVAFSEHLAFNRIFQVDELESVFTARLLATGQAGRYAATANLMLLGPMSWIAGAIDHSALLLRSERLLFFVVFWINLGLVVRCAGIRLRSTKGLFALVLVSTLAPLWDYGFEIRHDNVLLTAILLAWLYARPLGENARRNLFLVGVIAVVAQFIAFKAFAYVIPIVVFALIAATLEDKRPVLRSIAATAGGALTGFAACAIANLLSGTWSLFSSTTKTLTGTAVHATRFSATVALSRLIVECPLLIIATLFAIVIALRHWRGHGVASRESMLPELALFAVALVAIIVNPTPYPYNVVLLVPQAAILCLRLRPLAWIANPAWKTALGVILALHVLNWLVLMPRHLVMSNARQAVLMSTAEELTDPDQHAVLDGAGLVPTRHPPGHDWLIHSLNIHAFRNGQFEPIRAQLAEGHTPVIIPNYRTAWLPDADQQYMSAHYVRLAGDFLVAGTVIGGPAASWDCPVTGRYFVDHDANAAQPLLDGKPVSRGVVTLNKGLHAFATQNSGKIYVVWVGPKLDRPPLLGPGRADNVFFNWY